MKIKNLELTNFRQFRDAEIEFSTDSDQNITVIHGQNGSGKTTILNAFLWVLYEDLRSIKKEDRLANQGAMADAEVGDTITVEVELGFNHGGHHHTVRRRHVLRKTNATDYDGTVANDVFIVEHLDENGEIHEPNNPEGYIRQIVPKDLSSLFFFDGEYISDLSGIDNQGEIQNAIRQMMGLTILDRSIRHLDHVQKKFREELQAASSEELQALITQQEQLEEKLDDLNQDVEDKRGKKTNLQKEIQDIKSLLEQLDESAEFEEKRENLAEQVDSLEEKRNEINEEIESELSKHGFLTFAMPAIKDTGKKLDSLREAGEIPSELDNAFVDDLLEVSECICNRELLAGTPEYKEVEKYKSDVSADGLDQAAIKLISRFSTIRREQNRFFTAIDELIEERKSLTDEIDELEGEIEDISIKIEDLEDEVDDLETTAENDFGIDLSEMSSPSDLEAARREKQQLVDNLKKEIAVSESKIGDKKREIDELNDDISEAKTEKHEAELARKRMQIAVAIRSELKQHYEKFQDTVRTVADQKVDEIFKKVDEKGYKAEITDKFELRIRDPNYDTALEVDKSRGERQIASLSFIGSLVDIARERYNSNSDSDPDSDFFTGGIYPVVMDSPFGALDNTYRADVSQTIPLLADQVIVMVTDSQWEGPVQERMSERVGERYYLDYNENGGVEGSPVTNISAKELGHAGGD